MTILPTFSLHFLPINFLFQSWYSHSDFLDFGIGFKQLLFTVAPCYWFFGCYSVLTPEVFFLGGGGLFMIRFVYFLQLMYFVSSLCEINL
jgi:hypothetical protein